MKNGISPSIFGVGQRASCAWQYLSNRGFKACNIYSWSKEAFCWTPTSDGAMCWCSLNLGALRWASGLISDNTILSRQNCRQEKFVESQNSHLYSYSKWRLGVWQWVHFHDCNNVDQGASRYLATCVSYSQVHVEQSTDIDVKAGSRTESTIDKIP